MEQKNEIPASGKLAVSMAGHDKGRLYVVLEEAGGYYFLCDGKRKLLTSPKKKKEKHVQKILHLPEALLLLMGEIKTDADIRRILKEYRKLRGIDCGTDIEEQKLD